MLFLEFLALHLLLFLSLETIQAGAFSGEDKILMEMLSKANNCFTYRPNKDRGEKIKIPEEKIKLFGTKEQKIAKESVFEDMSKNGQLKQLKGENSTLRRRQVVVLPKKQFFTPPLTKDNQETNQPNSKISSGICGDYDGDNEIGVCLWSGNNFFGGWINGEMDHICNKEMSVIFLK
ncbi:hypothetical protein BY996DRAFT_717701 [Phakopsora pachyrhizi]|nr:hypothetical protein BY996DRAFT_717701 [Phakopsora pachyrhizi]